MPAHLRRPRRLLLASAMAALWIATVGATSVGALTTWRRDVYFARGYEHQIDSRTCTAAATAMMLNMIQRRDLNLSQRTVLRYAQPRDALNDAVQRGSDPLGWARAVSHYSRYTSHPTAYRWEAYSTKLEAQRRAVQQLARTGKPVGLLVAHGTHAMVLTGATSNANPATTDKFVVGSLAISDPNGIAHKWYDAPKSPLNSYLEKDATFRYDGAWYGKYVIIVPQR
ncbi:MAG TPA: hypothetical protein VH440_13280 [Candidatus Limnocylindrales bacterium]